MLIEKGHKVRFYPNTKQKILLEQYFGANRWVWNTALWAMSNFRKDENSYFSTNDISKTLTQIKKESEFDWLAAVPATSSSQTLENLKTAFKNFNNPKLKARYPKYKKRQTRASVRFQMQSTNMSCIYQPFNLFKLPKLGACKIKWPKNLGYGLPKMATASRSPDGKYWISFMTKTDIAQFKKTGKSIGIDVGLKTRAVDSDGNELAILNFTKIYAKRLARAQKVLARKNKDSNRRKRQVLRVASIHAKIANSRKNAIHKMTSKLVKNNDVICVESLNAKGMMRNRKLAKSLADASFGEIVRQLEYKCQWHDKTLIKIDRWFPSTKMCNGCGCLHDMPLNKRTMKCDCGVALDRDHNAAINILAEGLNRSLNVEGVAAVAGAFGHHQQVNPMKRMISQQLNSENKAGAEV